MLTLLIVASVASPTINAVCAPAVDSVTRLTSPERRGVAFRSAEELVAQFSRELEYQLIARSVPPHQREFYREICGVYFTGAVRGFGNALEEVRAVSNQR